MPAPVPDPTSRHFWDGSLRGELVFQRCMACTRFQYPPSVVCENCQSRQLCPTAVAGRGSLYALTVMHQSFLPVFVDEIPYVLVLVDIHEAPGVRMLSTLVDTDPASLSIGDTLEVVYDRRDDLAVPLFRKASGVRQ
jgi:uncharacterized OB-fold protein